MLASLLITGMLMAYPPSEVPPTYWSYRCAQNEMEYVGDFELTAYTHTGSNCADGVYPCAGVTVACNDERLWHKNIYIDGVGYFYCHDTGGMADNVVDIFMDSYDECIQFGRQSAKVYIVDSE